LGRSGYEDVASRRSGRVAGSRGDTGKVSLLWISESLAATLGRMGKVVYLSLGSNLGDRAANLREAIGQLEAAGTTRAVSAFYETQPVEVTDQPWFLNCVVALETEKTPRELLRFVLMVEAVMGRVRVREKGSRKIDIDIVFVDDRIIDEPNLKVPHPAMHRRRFVLEPLAEIAPDVRHPIMKKTPAEMLADLEEEQAVRRLDAESE
jgi:2-amino-4-hydroxy-6-hydroxymethyldihydropteridine diphosphokinase